MPDGGVDFGRDGSAQYVGAYLRRVLRCAAERGIEVGVFPGRELYVRRIQLFPGRLLIVEYWTIIVYCNQA